jgi:hypothetical protein
MRKTPAWLATALLLPGLATADGELGHKILGAVGLDAGSQAPEGIYAAQRFTRYSADELMNRRGDRVPIQGLRLDGYATALGVAGTYKPAGGSLPYFSAAFAVPVAWVSMHADLPPTSLDRFGLGDIFVEPLKVGWRLPHLDAVASYGFYAPTGQANRKGLGQPQWTQQFSLGGTAFLDEERAFRLSLLSSYNIYQRKIGIDITRGDSVQLQGGIGGRWFGILDAGVVGYALWQVGDDSGPDLPPALRGSRERVYGVGPEIGIAIPAIRGKLTARYEWDLGARSRPEGQVLVVGLSFLAWQPE